jgi:hypothetical protein
LLGLQYKIIYKKGCDNRVADALSRKSIHDSQCLAISSCVPWWLTDVVNGWWLTDVVNEYQLDEYTLSLMAKLALDPSVVPHFSITNGLLRYKNRIWVGANPQLHSWLLLACHDSPVGGQLGMPVTYTRLKQLFVWKGMKNDVHQYV